jgi:hypothetical protein
MQKIVDLLSNNESNSCAASDLPASNCYFWKVTQRWQQRAAVPMESVPSVAATLRKALLTTNSE